MNYIFHIFHVIFHLPPCAAHRRQRVKRYDYMIIRLTTSLSSSAANFWELGHPVIKLFSSKGGLTLTNLQPENFDYTYIIGLQSSLAVRRGVGNILPFNFSTNLHTNSVCSKIYCCRQLQTWGNNYRGNEIGFGDLMVNII